MNNSTQAIIRGEDLFAAGEYLEAKQAFDRGHSTSKKALALTKMMGTNLDEVAEKAFSAEAKQAAVADSAESNPAVQLATLGGNTPGKGNPAEHKRLAKLWKDVGTRFTINNIFLNETGKAKAKNEKQANDLATRKGLAQELFHLRSTAVAICIETDEFCSKTAEFVFQMTN